MNIRKNSRMGIETTLMFNFDDEIILENDKISQESKVGKTRELRKILLFYFCN